MNIKIIEREKGILAYVPESMRFFEINKKTKYIIEALNDNIEDQVIIDVYNISKKELTTLKNQLSMLNKMNTNESEKEKRNNMPGLYKLVLNISNACNLRCRYCYANGGSYQSDEGIMSLEVCKDALDLFYEKFENISVIQLFGGEPLMNMPLVKYVCEYVRKNKKNTQIGLVTNGTLINQEFIDLVKEYNIAVTVSYDGVPLVNDIMRVTVNGSGTSDVILSNIKKLYEQTGQPGTIEVTFNQKHIVNNVTIGDVLHFMRENVGNIPLHITAAGGDKSCDFVLEDRQAFVDSIDDIFDNPDKVPMYTYAIAAKMVTNLYKKERTQYLCSAGLNALSVSIDGDVYPCFMFTDDKSLCMGNIYDDEFLKQDKFKNIQQRLIDFKKENIPECKDCFMQKSCFGCLGINLLETGSVFHPSKESCDMYRQMMEQVIYRVYLKQKEATLHENAG